MLTHLDIYVGSPPLQTSLAYELPDPLSLRAEITEDTGAKIHNKAFVRGLQCSYFRYQIIDPGTSLRIESSWVFIRSAVAVVY